MFEGRPKVEAGKKYPICIEGERSCPPEDVGGVWGYPDFLEAIQSPDHKRHEELLGWIGGHFDPDEFDAVTTTKVMTKGLLHWK